MSDVALALGLLAEARGDQELTELGDLLRVTESVLTHAGIWAGNSFGSHRLEANAMVCAAAGLRSIVPEYREARLLPTERARLFDLLEERIRTRTPLPYLIGEVEYDGLRLEVRPGTFIPRNALEHVVDEVLETVLWSDPGRMLDIGTGVGSVAIAVARRCHQVLVDATDVSPLAIEVAERNVRRHRVGDRVTFLEGPLFSPVPTDRRYDLIASNLPYIPEGNRPNASEEVQKEPEGAIFGRGDGLDLARAVLVQAARHLQPKGLLVLEVGAGRQAREIDWITGGHGRWWSWRGHELGLVTLRRDDLER